MKKVNDLNTEVMESFLLMLLKGCETNQDIVDRTARFSAFMIAFIADEMDLSPEAISDVTEAFSECLLKYVFIELGWEEEDD